MSVPRLDAACLCTKMFPRLRVSHAQKFAGTNVLLSIPSETARAASTPNHCSHAASPACCALLRSCRRPYASATLASRQPSCRVQKAVCFGLVGACHGDKTCSSSWRRRQQQQSPGGLARQVAARDSNGDIWRGDLLSEFIH
eukprot:6172476-Pleurochrysis_carterae.AAC.1